MQFTKKTVIVSLFFCIIFGFLFWIFTHEYTQQKILQLNLEEQKLSQISTNILNYKNKYGNLEEYMEKLEERFQLSSRILPENISQGEFINFLQRTALENNIKIISLTPSTIQPVYDDSENKSEAAKSEGDKQGGTLIKLPIDLKIEGTYLSMIKFLESLEKSERLMNVEEVSITSKDDGDRLNCDLKIIIFAMKI